VDNKRVQIEEFPIGGQQLALLSVVPFLDTDFCFPRVAPGIRVGFGQTNHRIYVRDRRTGEPCVWFLGTTLGSPLVQVPRTLWDMPWHRAQYDIGCNYDRATGRYLGWRMFAQSDWCGHEIELEDTGVRADRVEGFDSRADFLLRLTHPVSGFFRRLDGETGRYSIWHPLMRGLTVGRARKSQFTGYPRWGIMSREEMAAPHSVLMLPKVRFRVHLPPKLA